VTRPPGIRYTLTSDWVAVTRAVTNALNARLILGVNLEADNPRLASGEASAFVSGLGGEHIDALELGNEPELYDAFAWYQLPNGQKVLGRPKTWDYSAFASDFGRIAGALPRSVPLAAPSIGSPEWSPNLAAFLRSQPRTAVATLHRYPLKRCRASTHHTVGELLSTSSTTGLADGVARYVTTAHSHHIPLRIDEMNSISCGGQHGLSDSFASALWAVDALYEMARVGVDGVNIHTSPNLTNELFYFHHIGSWRGAVRPIYYGLLLFAQAAPAGARLQRVDGQTPTALRVWATKATDGTVRTVLINDGSAAHAVRLKIASDQSSAQATLEQLRAPGATALSGVTIGGQSFGLRTTTGLLEGRQATAALTPRGGFYTLTVPPWSAALVTVARP
jgi:Glycosyl hydrolase family 79 C-terminal beta domain